MKYILWISLLILSSCMDHQEVSVSHYVSTASIENEFVRIVFDLHEGEYKAIDKTTGETVLEEVSFCANGCISTDGYMFQSNDEAVSEELGNGRKLILKGSKPNSLSLSLELTLYAKRTYICLAVGVGNTGTQPVNVMRFSPAEGMAYHHFDFPDYKTLDGDSGSKPTRVRTTDSITSNNNILITFGQKGLPKHSMVLGGLTYNEFRKYASAVRRHNYLDICLWADDPVGKRIDAGEEYIFNDRFYLDFSTKNRFESLEQYGLALRKANHARIKGVDFPILNFWYCYVNIFGNSKFKNNSPGVIEKLEEVGQTGFLKYTKMGVRLEPDDYAMPNNQQGWWDDEHWQQYKGGQLLEPYETIRKWGDKVKSLGGEPFIYCQTARRSEDYCKAYPEHCLFNDSYYLRSSEAADNRWEKGPIGDQKYWAYDFTDTAFIAHMKQVYANLKEGGLKGIKFDYPFTGWAYDGGFEDKYATTTSAYRNIFQLAYDGLGAETDIQERIPPYGDVALGVVTTQRTEGDCDWVYPGRTSKTGLRWYKNRVVINYDNDPVNPCHTYPVKTKDGWRSALTLTFFNSARMEIGKYFGEMTKEQIHDLTRVVPLLSTTKSPRPIDAFEGHEYPKVYDYSIDDDWHILYFYNYKIENQKWPDTDLAYGWGQFPHFVPNKMLDDTISVSLADATDDGGLSLNADKEYYIFDFWNWTLLEKADGKARLTQILRPGETRVMSVHEVKHFPQFISTNRHIMQGFLDMVEYPVWNSTKKELSAVSKVVSGDVYKVVIATNGYAMKGIDVAGCEAELVPFDKEFGLYELIIHPKQSENVGWSISFK